jgi:uncharacterized membrane protein YhaH (DUF805 family)
MNWLGPTTRPDPHGRRNFLIGLGAGLVPMVLAMIAIGLGGASSNGSEVRSISSAIGNVVFWLYALEFLAMLVLLFVREWRRVGLRLLTAMLVSVVVACVGYLVLVSRLQ